jgi:ATP-dependent 26S proteasome regulatory subunit
MSLQRGINFRSLAEKMGNCSGAEVRGICTEAGTSSFLFCFIPLPARTSF